MTSFMCALAVGVQQVSAEDAPTGNVGPPSGVIGQHLPGFVFAGHNRELVGFASNTTPDMHKLFTWEGRSTEELEQFRHLKPLPHPNG